MERRNGVRASQRGAMRGASGEKRAHRVKPRPPHHSTVGRCIGQHAVLPATVRRKPRNSLALPAAFCATTLE